MVADGHAVLAAQITQDMGGALKVVGVDEPFLLAQHAANPRACRCGNRLRDLCSRQLLVVKLP